MLRDLSLGVSVQTASLNIFFELVRGRVLKHCVVLRQRYEIMAGTQADQDECMRGDGCLTWRGVCPRESLRGRVSETGWSGGSSVMIMLSTLACRPACNLTPDASYITCTTQTLVEHLITPCSRCSVWTDQPGAVC